MDLHMTDSDPWNWLVSQSVILVKGNVFLPFFLIKQNAMKTSAGNGDIFFLPRCSHTWERAPVSEHRADFTQFLNQDGR
jgi:hypothetical protein